MLRRGPMIQARLSFVGDVSVHQTVAPSPFLEARHTSAQAAVAAAPAKARKSAELLRLVTLAGTDGLSDPEIERATGFPRQTICSVRNSVRHLLWPADRETKSKYGKKCVCWRRATAAEVAVNRERVTAIGDVRSRF